MKIGIDIRMIHNTGIGRYIHGLINSAEKSTYVRFGDRQNLINSPVFSIREQAEVPFRQLGHDLDLWHAPQFNVPLLSKFPVVVTIHDTAFDLYPEEFPGVLAKAYYKAMMPLAIKRARRIIVPSDATRKDLLNIYKVNENKIAIIPHGIDEKLFWRKPTSKDAETTLKTYGIKKPFILFVGLRKPRKNIPTLLKAMRQVDRNIELVIAGPKDDRFVDVGRMIKALDIENRVVETGRISEFNKLHALYHEADALVLPSLCEGFGFPVLEAMACQTPVIASDIGVLHEAGGDACAYVDPRSEIDITQTINRVINIESLRNDLVRKGSQRVKEFTWARALENTMKAYEKALDI
ncbi:glycosyltransferase family 4 protein [Elusimicrobiota bacterium]